MTWRVALLLAALTGLLAAPAAFAQVAPDAGRTLRELEQPGLTLPRPPPQLPSLEQPVRPALKPAPEARFAVKAFRVTGNTVFAEAELLALVADAAGREAELADLEQAAARITRFYRERGYPVARAYLPAQDIRDGVVEIAVLEGRFGKVQLRNKSRVRDAAAAAYLEPLQGRVIQEDSFERRLLLLYDLPGVSAPDAALRPGGNAGEADLAVALEGGPAAAGSVELDNHGNRFTGGTQLSGQLALSSPTGSGDALTARLTKGDPGLEYLRLGYQLPVGGDGLALGARYSRTRYRLGRQFAALEADGEGEVWGATAAYPFVRSRRFNLYGQAGYEARKTQDRVGATATVTDKRARAATLGISGDARDALVGGGVTAFSLVYSGGRLDLQSAAARALDDATARTHGGYSKWNLSVLRLQALAERLSLFLSLSVQKAGKNLDSGEKFVLGGASGVRAYPSGEASGDSGSLFTVEVRRDLAFDGVPGVVQPFVFLDTGEVRINEHPFALGENRRRLSAAGIGVTWQHARDFQLRAVFARKVGNARATSDTDADGRFWIQAVKYF